MSMRNDEGKKKDGIDHVLIRAGCLWRVQLRCEARDECTDFGVRRGAKDAFEVAYIKSR